MNTLITSVYQKTREIGILKALGANDRCVTFIFILQGFLIGVIGSVTGTLAGVLVIFYRNDIMKFASKTFHVELFPKQFYYFDGLPAHIVATDVLIIVGASVVLCTLGALLPALRAALLDPAKALRYE
ncbi:MAG: FtsX-like permease family protein [Lentisphaeria bacterium]|nr:FtsX-like permease family protein [Lentisphaeria bacterium]